MVRRRKDQNPLGFLPLSGKARSLLAAAGVRTLDEFGRVEVPKLQPDHYCGHRTLQEISDLKEFLGQLEDISTHDSVDTLPLGAKAQTVAAKAGIKTVEGFLQLDVAEVKNLHGCGREATRQIKTMQDLLQTVLVPATVRKPVPAVRLAFVRASSCHPAFPEESLLHSKLLDLIQPDRSDIDTYWSLFSEAGSVAEVLGIHLESPELQHLEPLLGDHAETLLGLSLGRLAAEVHDQGVLDAVVSKSLQLVEDLSTKPLTGDTGAGSPQPFLSPLRVRGAERYMLRDLPFCYPGRRVVLESALATVGDLAGASERDLVSQLGLSGKVLQLVAALHILSGRLAEFLPGLHDLTTAVSRFNGLEQLVDSLAKQLLGSRNSTVYLLRSGFLTGSPLTLDEVASVIGRTRERVRQIHKQAVASLQEAADVNPLLKRVLFEVRQSVASSGGISSPEDIAGDLRRAFRWRHRPSRQGIMELVALDAELVTQDEFVSAARDECGTCHSLLSKIRDEVRAKGKVDLDDVVTIRSTHCLSTCPKLPDVPRAFGATAARCIVALNLAQAEGVVVDGSVVYDSDYWELHHGPLTSAVAEVLRRSEQAMSADEICERLKGIRTSADTLNSRYVYSCLGRLDEALLWERGRYLHVDRVLAPETFVQEVHDWALAVFRKEHIPFMSCNRPFLQFAQQCGSHSIASEYALCSLLKRLPKSRLNIPKSPYLYPPGSAARIPLHLAVETFIDEAGEAVSNEQVRDYALGKLGLKDYSLDVHVIPGLTGILRTGDGGFVHVNNLPVVPSKLADIAISVRSHVARRGHISVIQVFEQNEIVCRMMGLTDPMMVFSALREYHDDTLDFGVYPQVRPVQSDAAVESLGMHALVVDYVRTRGDFCTLEELEDHFVEEQRYGRRTVYNALSQSPDVLPYLPGCVVHREAIHWDEALEERLARCAGDCWAEATVSVPYVPLEAVLESSLLPPLSNGLIWTPDLLAALLDRMKSFKMLDKHAGSFVLVPNNFGVENLSDLVVWLLGHVFEGGVSVDGLMSYLVSKQILRQRVNRAFLLDDERLTVVGDELMLSGLVTHSA